MSTVRTHFCTLVARGKGAGSRPVRYGMNGTMPATVNSSDGSGEISEALGTTVWSRAAKCSRKRRRISAVCMVSTRVGWAWAREGRSVLGGVRTAPDGQPDLVPRGQRGVQAGAGPQFGLALGGRGTDVGPEGADGLGQVAQRLGDRAGDAAGGQLLGGAGELADDEGTDGDAHGQ